METTPATTETTMNNPPANQSKMVAPKKKKSWKVKALQPFMIGSIEYGTGGQVKSDTTRIVQVGEIVELDNKAKVKELLLPIKGPYAFSGERHNSDGDVTRHDHTRARLATEQDLFEAKPLTPLDDELEDDKL